MREIEYPIFVFEGSHVDMFMRVADAAQYLEAIDVNAGIFEGFDARGRSLSIIANYADEIKITLSEQVPTHQDELRKRLLHSLDHVGYEIQPSERESLSIVVASYVQYIEAWKKKKSRIAPTEKAGEVLWLQPERVRSAPVHPSYDRTIKARTRLSIRCSATPVWGTVSLWAP